MEKSTTKKYAYTPKKYLTEVTNLDGHDGEGDPETADRVGDEDEADHHHESRRHQHRLDRLKENG